MTTVLTILGCGSSTGVPRIGGDWGSCDPANPRNRRRRCSLLISATGGGGATHVLIDTSPDLREQALATNLDHIDAVLYTHEHADHTHGIDDLRGFFLRQRQLIPLWADEATGQVLMARFPYCFAALPGSDYPPIASLSRLVALEEVSLVGAGGTITARPFRLHHGNIEALGFRIGGVAYTPDLNGIPDVSRESLANLDLWIVDALRRTPHPSHFCLAETLAWIEKMQPKRAVITNMHCELDYETLRRELPPNVEPAYDGMQVTL